MSNFTERTCHRRMCCIIHGMQQECWIYGYIYEQQIRNRTCEITYYTQLSMILMHARDLRETAMICKTFLQAYIIQIV